MVSAEVHLTVEKKETRSASFTKIADCQKNQVEYST